MHFAAKMKGETQLNSAVFQLTPTRTRCELVISAGGKTEKLASGLLKPFLTHLKTAEEQIAKGGYSIRLEPPSGPNQHVSWFTKGTIERFVRFVSTPEVLERVNTIETEIIQIEDAINVQCSDALVAEEQPLKSSHAEQKEAGRPNVDENLEGAIVPFKSRRQSVDGIEPAHGENSKACLLRVLETRKMVLQKEQGMAFARAAAAGFDMDHMHDLVSFADCFGAFRLREACVNFMGLWKKKQEAGIWLEEMELETMEASSTRSEIGLINASGITLNSDSVRRLKPKDFSDAWSDVPSEVGDSKISSLDGISSLGKSNGAEAIIAANGENSFASHNGVDGLVSPGLAGSNDYSRGHFQQPMMPVWQGQAPQHMQGFQSHGVGQGHTMQGLHGFPMQGVPYYQSYPPNPPFYQGIYPQGDEHPGLAVPSPHLLSHWPRYAEDARFGITQRAEPHSNISANIKRSAMDERDGNVKSETSETGSSKSLSRSLDLAEPDIQSEPEKEDIPVQESHRHMQRRSTSPRRRSPSPRRKVQIGRSGNKRSGMVVIRNINYITSKRHDRTGKEDISEESNSEADSDVEDDLKKKAEDVHLRVQDVIGLFEKKTKETEESSKKKERRRHSADSWNVGDNEAKSAGNDPSTDAGGRDVDSESWSIFQKFLLRDDESPRNNLENDHNGEAHAVEQAGHQRAVIEEDMIVVDRDDLGSKDWTTTAVSLDQELGSQKKERWMEKDSLVLPERNRGDVLLDSLPLAESEETSVHKMSTTYDDFIISSEAGQMTIHGADSDPFAGDKVEHMINRQSGYLHLEKNNGISLGDDSFMVSTTSMLQDQASNEWRTVMNIDSELPTREQAETSSNGIRKSQLEVTDSYEPAELYMLPERNSEGDSLGILWDPAMDYEMQANMADKVHSDADLNDPGDENKSSKVKLDTKAKEQPRTKKSEKEARLKAMQEALEKRKAEMAARNAKLSKSNPLAEAQLRAEKLRAFKAGLQKTKKEMEEEERKRLEELKMQRQKRIAARRSSSPTSSSSTSRSMKQHQAKPGLASKLLSPNVQKGQMSRNLSPGGSFSGTRSISTSTSDVTNRLRSHKQNTSNHTKPAENVLSRSVPSLSELKKEIDETFNASKRSSATRKSSDNVVSSKNRKEVGSSKPNGATSNSAACSSDNSDTKKRHLPATRKNVTGVSQSKDKSSKGSLDSDTSFQKVPKNIGVHAVQRGKASNLATGVGNVKSKGNTLVDASKKHNDEIKLTESDEPNSLKALRPATSARKKEPENATISDNVSGKKLGVGSGSIPIHAPASMDARDVAAQNPSDSMSDSFHLKEYEAMPIQALVKSVEEYEIDKVSESAAVPLAMHGSPNSAESNALEDEGNVLQPSSSMLQISESDEPYHAPLARLTSFDDRSYNKSSTYNAPLAPEISSGLQGVFIPRAPISENDSPNTGTSDFPNTSPLLQNMPKLPQSISPAAESGKLDTFYSRQKGSSAEKTKESVKGFKRLLKFGRKSHNSSTTADNYEDADHLREAESRIPEDQGGNLDVTKDVSDANSHLSRITSGAAPYNGADQANSLGSLISQDDDNSVVNTHKASRSFFSLSTFRSKGSETKSR